MDAQPFDNELTYQTHEQGGSLAEFHAAYEATVESVRESLGERHPHVIGGEAVASDDRRTVTSPGDTAVTIGEFAAGDAATVDRAVATAREAFDGWRDSPVAERVALFREAADRLADRKFEFAALLTLENGKTRTEAMADVDEAIDFLRYYAREFERTDGYRYDTGEPTPGEHCENVLRPYGVFAVLAPFNFPLAILAGMTTGAVITGNTAVVKPAEETPLVAHRFLDVLVEAGLPDGVVNLVTGGGDAVGRPLVEHADVAGVAFTGSRAVGLEIQRTFLEAGKRGPVIAELGGKNPVVVTETADLDAAANGVAMGAFSFAGQKCSATSRVYVAESVREAFTERLVARTDELVVGPPDRRATVVSPVIRDDALARYRSICARAREVGEVLTGGRVLATPDGDGEGEGEGDRGEDLPPGRYVAPTVVTGVSHDHDLAREEHFLPFVTVHPIADLAEGIEKSNDSDYGLCAGLFSTDDDEIDEWLDRVESGMCYVNRERSATTGALVSAQPFGGWKFSGTTGTFAGGRWYLPQFMREQSRTVVGEAGRDE